MIVVENAAIVFMNSAFAVKNGEIVIILPNMCPNIVVYLMLKYLKIVMSVLI